MRNIHRFPAGVLTFGGVLLVARGFQRYLDHLVENPSHELGMLAELLFFVYLLIGIAVIGLGVISFNHDRIALPMAVITFGLVIGVGLIVDLWINWENTQLALSVLLSAAVTVSLLVWLIGKSSHIQRLRPS